MFTEKSRPHRLCARAEFEAQHVLVSQNGARAISDATAATTSSAGVKARWAGLLSCRSASATHNMSRAQKASFVPLQNSYLMQQCLPHSTQPRCRPDWCEQWSKYTFVGGHVGWDTMHRLHLLLWTTKGTIWHFRLVRQGDCTLQRRQRWCIIWVVLDLCLCALAS